MLLLFRAWLVPYLPRLPGWLQALSEPVLQGGPAPNPSLWSLDAAVVVYESQVGSWRGGRFPSWDHSKYPQTLPAGAPFRCPQLAHEGKTNTGFFLQAPPKKVETKVLGKGPPTI